MQKSIRYIRSYVNDDLGHKIVFIGGPRQVGKTTLALSFLNPSDKKNPAYLNWDISKHKKNIINQQLPRKEPLIVLDEIHKYNNWRNLIKGLYDEYSPEKSFIVTGSARLDYYRKGGDSLLGRYFHYRLHPFSLWELNNKPSLNDAEQMLTLGGFPEPYTKSSKRFWARWNRTRIEQILSEDLRDLEKVNDINLIELLIESLPERITTPIALNQLAKLLQVSQDSINRWLQILERLYFIYSVLPYGEARIKAIKKEKKFYFWDWAYAGSRGAIFENMVAGHLLKYCHFKEDTEGAKMELRYLRDIDKREVDFVLLKNKKPLFAIECKYGDREICPAIEYFLHRTKIPIFYQVHMGNEDYEVSRNGKKIRVLPFWKLGEEIDLI